MNARAWARPAAAVAAAVVALMVGPVAGTSATASPAVTASAPAATVRPTTTQPDGLASDEPSEDPGLDVEITEIGPAILRPEETLRVTGTVTNQTDEDLTAPAVQVRMQRSTPVSRTSLNRWLDPDSTFGTALVAQEELPERLPAGATVSFTLEVPAADLPVRAGWTAWGPRGIEVAVTDGQGTAHGVDRSFVLWYPDVDVEPTPVGVLAPVAATAEERTRARESGEPLATAAEKRVLPLVEALDRPGVTALVDPMLLSLGDDAAPEPGEGAPEPGDGASATPSATAGETPTGDDHVNTDDSTATDGADQPAATSRVHDAITALAAADDREVSLLPWADADVAALAHLGRTDLLNQSVNRATTAGQAAGLDAEATVAWPATATPDRQTLEAAADTGAAAVVLPSGALTPVRNLTYTPAGRADVVLADGSELAALVVDGQASAALGGGVLPGLGGTAADETELDPLTARQLLLAETAVIARERPSDPRALVLALPRGFTGDPVALASTLDALAAAPWVAPTTLTDLVQLPAPVLERTGLPRVDVAGGEVGAGDLLRMQRVRDDAVAFAAITEDPDGFVAPFQEALLTALSAAWRTDPAGRDALVASVQAQVGELDAQVAALPSSTVNLINSSAQIPIHVRNDLDVDVQVEVVLEPTDPRLQAREAVPLAVPAGAQATAQVPVRAVGSGDLPVNVLLRSDDGTAVGTPAKLQVRVRADWENVGTAVVAGVLAVMLVVGLVRTVRRGPRMDPGTPVPDPEG
ncbi:hypothetical protein FE374_18930 [Georgenia yuyongxinii]|uniref:Glycoprotein n=1 Tax=Georgenia yuyongxinii TaxID=2589797 RepID=A0A5B8C7H1_9MICO|nr:DUF6049 family protein [Georgenia yuyongxinii]QDC26404.1 hypothetical protein FE374_18930 [Georgenia yuyongxinii]